MTTLRHRLRGAGVLVVVAGTTTLLAQRGQPSAAPTPAAEPPRLVVMIVVDQMRADYITLFSHQWTRGLRRLVDTSAMFPLARYPFSATVTCPGHATISTGTYPATHGMIGNDWYDRDRRRNTACTEDAAITSVPFGGRPGVERQSPARLSTRTFTDELRLQASRPPTVVALSLKARSAIALAGHPGASTYAIWLEDAENTWATSTAYTSAPWPMVNAYVTAFPPSGDYGRVWERALPPSAYLFTDLAAGELAPGEFPYPLDSKAGTPDAEFAKKWRRSPMSDRYLGQFAQHLARELRLGQSPGTDYLGVSFSALDLVGHEYGPKSHEIQDLLLRLDATLGALFDTLDQLVGRHRYVVALSSDHGVAPIPEQVREAGLDGGRYQSARVRTAINTALASLLGEGPQVAAMTSDNVYLAPGVLSRVLATPGARDAVTRAIIGVEGIARAYWADELASTTPTDDPFLRAGRLSYFAGRSGDILVVPDPYWMARAAAGTTHGTPFDYDQRVPVLFAGAAITPGRYLVPASPADIAPTLAHLVGITLARTDGQVRTEAIR